jgi:hypothetical protein
MQPRKRILPLPGHASVSGAHLARYLWPAPIWTILSLNVSARAAEDLPLHNVGTVQPMDEAQPTRSEATRCCCT